MWATHSQKQKGVTNIGTTTTESGSEDEVVVAKKGKSRAAAGINVTMLFVVDEAGKPIDGHRATDIRDHARSIWKQLLNNGMAPKKWKTDISVEINQYYRCVHYN
jgi:hypothetical protein